MRNGDVRRLCVALVHNRVTVAVPGPDPQPAALGWQLEQRRQTGPAITALCAGALSGSEMRVLRWRPSPALEALLSEYASVRLEGTLPARDAERHVALPRRAAAH